MWCRPPDFRQFRAGESVSRAEVGRWGPYTLRRQESPVHIQTRNGQTASKPTGSRSQGQTTTYPGPNLANCQRPCALTVCQSCKPSLHDAYSCMPHGLLYASSLLDASLHELDLKGPLYRFLRSSKYNSRSEIGIWGLGHQTPDSQDRRVHLQTRSR